MKYLLRELILNKITKLRKHYGNSCLFHTTSEFHFSLLQNSEVKSFKQILLPVKKTIKFGNKQLYLRVSDIKSLLYGTQSQSLKFESICGFLQK